MMGPTFSYIAWGCGKDQEEDSEDSSDNQEVKEDAKLVADSQSLPKEHKEEHHSSAEKPETSEKVSAVSEHPVCSGGKEAVASVVENETSEQQPETENLQAASDAQLSESAVTSICAETTGPCNIKGDTGCADSSISDENTAIQIGNVSVSTEQTNTEEGTDCPKEINQSSVSGKQTDRDTECTLNQETGLDLQSNSLQGEASSSQDRSLGIGTDCSALNQDILCEKTDTGATLRTKEETTTPQDNILEEQRDHSLEHTTSYQDSSLAALTGSDCTKQESEQSVAEAPETANHTISNPVSHVISSSASGHTRTMAAETAQPLTSLQEAGVDTSPLSDLPSALTKDADSGTPPAEERLSPRESPEPAEEGASKGSGGTEGSSATASGSSESKSEQDSKTTAAAKTKKKEDKSIEYILRALSSLNSSEEKLAALCKKYADLHEEHRVLQTSFKSQQRKMTVGQREKDQLQAEHTKAVIAKSKLESLCRELQKQNKAVKEESILRQKEEEEKRKEISAKFQTTIGEIQTQMTENHEKNVKLREENHDLASKLKKFLEQEELREQQIDKLTKHRELENQLAETKLAHAAAILKEQEEKHLKEKELLLLQTAESHKKNTMLEAQLNMYKDRYEEFQGTINKSNDMFQKLKSEMDKMGKRIKKLEKEGAQWRAKWEASNKALLDMAEEKSRSDKEKQLLQTKIVKLESLCRALQGELHGKKSGSPKPSSSAADTSKPTPAPAVQDSAVSTSSPASTTATPPNTPEENTSRASPNPDSPASLPPSLPTGQNGPIAASLSVPVPSSSTESAEPEEVAEEESSTMAESETPSSCPAPDVGSVLAAATTQLPEQAEAVCDPSVSSSADEAV